MLARNASRSVPELMNEDKTIRALIALAGFTPDEAINFIENQPNNALQFASKVAAEIKE